MPIVHLPLWQVGDFGLARLGESTAEGRVVTVRTEMVVVVVVM